MPDLNLKKKIKTLTSAGLDFLFPENIYCLCCGDSMESSRIHGICDACAEKIDWNVSNPLEVDMDQFAFDELLRCCVYGFYPRRIMSGFKLAGRPYAARPLGKLLGERLVMSGLEPNLMCCVPMHRDKEEKRGFNQADLLARYACEEYENRTGKRILYVRDLLIKPFDTKSMRMSTGEERKSISTSTFHTSSKYADIIKDRKVVLVDDVVTTGSTSDACARTLKEAGADKVYVLCFAGCSGYAAADERE